MGAIVVIILFCWVIFSHKSKKQNLRERCNVCNECGKTWFYTKEDMQRLKDARKRNEWKKLTIFLGTADVQEVDPFRCPNCGSRNVSER